MHIEILVEPARTLLNRTEISVRLDADTSTSTSPDLCVANIVKQQYMTLKIKERHTYTICTEINLTLAS